MVPQKCTNVEKCLGNIPCITKYEMTSHRDGDETGDVSLIGKKKKNAMPGPHFVLETGHPF